LVSGYSVDHNAPCSSSGWPGANSYNCLRLRTDMRGQPDLPTVVSDNSALRFRGHAATRCTERSLYKPIDA
jgi:hypothetical protein